MPESKKVAGGDLKSTQDGAPEEPRWYVRFYMPLAAIVVIPLLSVWFFLFQRCITLSMARQIRAAIFRDKTWHFWQFGFLHWFILNGLMLTLEQKKGRPSAKRENWKHAIDAIYSVRTIYRRDHDIHLLFDLWNEFQIRDSGTFATRNRDFFMIRLGWLFNDQAREFLCIALTLSDSEYEALEHICCRAIDMMRDRFCRIGPFESAFVNYFTSNKAFCCQRIREFKVLILRMARCYIDNMVQFCIEHELAEAAHAWVEAGRQIIALQELDNLRVDPDCVRKHLDLFFEYADMAGRHVYVEYQQLDMRVADICRIESSDIKLLPCPEPPPDDVPAQQPIVEAPAGACDAWTAFYDRDVLWFHISADGSTITDTTSLREDGSYEYEYTGITENASVVRRGLAFFFGDFDKNCKAHQDDSGDWIVTQENDFTKMLVKDMKKFKTSLKAIPGMKNFIPDILRPKSTEVRTDGKANNRSGKYRIDPQPASTSDYGATCQLDAIE